MLCLHCYYSTMSAVHKVVFQHAFFSVVSLTAKAIKQKLFGEDDSSFAEVISPTRGDTFNTLAQHKQTHTRMYTYVCMCVCVVFTKIFIISIEHSSREYI